LFVEAPSLSSALNASWSANEAMYLKTLTLSTKKKCLLQMSAPAVPQFENCIRILLLDMLPGPTYLAVENIRYYGNTSLFNVCF